MGAAAAAVPRFTPARTLGTLSDPTGGTRRQYNGGSDQEYTDGSGGMVWPGNAISSLGWKVQARITCASLEANPGTDEHRYTIIIGGTKTAVYAHNTGVEPQPSDSGFITVSDALSGTLSFADGLVGGPTNQTDGVGIRVIYYRYARY